MLDLDNDLNNPSLYGAYLLGLSSKKFGLDWEDLSQVIYKVEEEWQELKEELKPGISPDQKQTQERIEEEIGDLLFSVAQLARHLHLNPEKSLALANKKFVDRVGKVDGLIKGEGLKWEDLSFKQLDEYWERAKLL